MTFSRTIVITGQDIGGNPPTLIFTFDQQGMEGIYKKYFPVVWKVSPVPSTGPFATTATYTSQLLFTNPQIENGKVIQPQTWVNIDLGQKTDLIKEDSVKRFTKPAEGVKGYIEAKNGIEDVETIGIGFNDGSNPPSTAMVFKDVGYDSSVIAEFTPILSIYIVSGRQKNAVLDGEIKTGLLWRENLAKLTETTNWMLSREFPSGKYQITRV